MLSIVYVLRRDDVFAVLRCIGCVEDVHLPWPFRRQRCPACGCEIDIGFDSTPAETSLPSALED